VRSRPGVPFFVILLAAVLALLARGTALRARAELPALPPARIGLPPGYVKLATLSFHELAADLLWIRFVQDTPLHPADEALGRALSAELAAVTDLDPHFRSAYLHGSILLSVLGNQSCAALGELEQGARRFPTDFRLPFEAGYNCFSELGDMACAADYMERAAALPDSPRWLPGLVARLMADSSRGQAAVEYLARRLESEQDPELRARFSERLGQAILARDTDALQEAVRTWRLRHGGPLPPSLDALVADGLIPSLPAEPFGGRYFLGPDGRVANEDPRQERPLHAYRRENVLGGNIRERIFQERVEGRRDDLLGKPWWIQDRLDLLATEGGVLTESLQGLETLAAIDPEHRMDLRIDEGRVILEHDVRRLIDAAIALRQEDPTALPSLAGIEGRAGVPDHDVFGTPFRLDESGMPAAAPGRSRLVLVKPGKGLHPCL